jgi:hypothetical protein
MTTDKELIADKVNSAADRWGNYDSIQDADWLDVKVVAGLDGEPREFILVTATGGPHIEVNVSRGRVEGNWGTDSHSSLIYDNDEVLDSMHEYFEIQWESV